ncbi:MAG: hypothetical protein HRT90_02385 [Candidatus Margulisbacteria bacterium]|nr:hypothetical protein [Candidatus Margulisiibacteriota bacterium]
MLDIHFSNLSGRIQRKIISGVTMPSAPELPSEQDDVHYGEQLIHFSMLNGIGSEEIKRYMRSIIGLITIDGNFQLNPYLLTAVKLLSRYINSELFRSKDEEVQIHILRTFSYLLVSIPLYSKALGKILIDPKVLVSKYTIRDISQFSSNLKNMCSKNHRIEFEAARSKEILSCFSGRGLNATLRYADKVINAIYQIQQSNGDISQLSNSVSALKIGSNWLNDSIFFQVLGQLASRNHKHTAALIQLVHQGIDKSTKMGESNKKKWLYMAIQALEDVAVSCQDSQVNKKILDVLMQLS